jgi:branched-chain amino acid transport system substrate-binding protein
MAKRTLVLFIGLIFVAGLVFAGGQQEQQVKIGFIGPLTGDYANYGNLQSQAVQLAIDARNEAGGIGGNEIVLISEDSEADVARGNAAIEKLASVDQIDALVGGVFSTVSLAIAPRAQTEQIVMISGSATHPDLTGNGDYIFRTIASDALQGRVFGEYVYEELGFEEVAILYTRNDYSQGLTNVFTETFESAGGSVVATESGIQGDRDFRTQLTTIRAENPDAIFLPNYVAEIAQVLEQAEQLGIDATMLSADGFSNPEIFDLAGPLTNGVIFSGPPADEAGAGGKAEAFEEEYTERFGVGPDSFSYNAYDAANIILDAIQHAYDQANEAQQAELELDPTAIRDYVAGIEGYSGVSGTITFAESGDVVKNIGIFEVQNQEFQQTGVYTVVDGQLQAQ